MAQRLYECAAQLELTTNTFSHLRDEASHVTSSLSETAKRERLILLRGLLEDYKEIGDGEHELRAQAEILHNIGMVLQDLGEWHKARQYYDGSLDIERELGNKSGVASTLHQLGRLAELAGDYVEGLAHAKEAEEIFLQLGNPDHIEKIKHQREDLEQQVQENS